MARAMARGRGPSKREVSAEAAALVAKYGRGRQWAPFSGCGVEKTGHRALVDELIADQVSYPRIAEIFREESKGYVTPRILQTHAQKNCSCYRKKVVLQ